MRVFEYEDCHYSLLQEFCSSIDVINNNSADELIDNSKPNSKIFLVMVDDIIINMSIAHDFSAYYPGTYRILSRTATLPQYRGYGVLKQRNMCSAAGVAANTVTMQVEHGRQNGATEFLFTTNWIGGMESSKRLSRFLKAIESVDCRFSYYGVGRIYGCDQLVWKLNYEDIINLTGPLSA